MSDGTSAQAYLVFANGTRDVAPATKIRSTLVMSSQKTLRDAELFDEYDGHLDAYAKKIIAESSTPRWLDIEVGLSHYRACDALGLGANRVSEMAQKMSMQRRGTFLGVAVGLAAGLGVTPWTVLGQASRVWQRAWVGGAIGSHKLAEQEARLEVAGWPCAQIPYCRHALRGLILGVITLLSPQATVLEVQGLQSDTAIAYRVAWR